MASRPTAEPLHRFDAVPPLTPNAVDRARRTIHRFVVDPGERISILEALGLPADDGKHNQQTPSDRSPRP